MWRAWFVFSAVFAALALPACSRSFVSEDLTSGETTSSTTSTSTTSSTTGTGGMPGFCGDGVVGAGEQCDDGDSAPGDGCSALCLVELGWACSGEPSTCSTVCGDGLVVFEHEDCDDGNTQNGDGCDQVCMIETPQLFCGDGIVTDFEQCDDGNDDPGDGCTSFCTIEQGFSCFGEPSTCFPVCGDAILVSPEQCDDGNTFTGDGCGATCKVEVGWSCNGSSPTFCAPVCGDGIVVDFEQCDDGNTVSGDGCSSICTIEPGSACGDGVKAGAEQCDDGNLVGGDCCSPTCQIEAGCEIEVNDSIGTANDFNAIAIGGVVKAFIRPGNDRDFFSIVVPPNAKATISATVLDGFLGKMCAANQMDTFLTIYDQNGGTIGSDDDSGIGFCSKLTVNGLPPGTYFVEARKTQFGGMMGFDYTLQITTDLSICGNGTKEIGEACDDGNLVNGDGCSSLCLSEGTLMEVEPNDTFAQADANAANAGLLFTGDALVGGSVQNGNDKDIFKLVLAAPTVLRFETFDLSLDDCTSTTKTRLTIFNASLLQVVSDTQSGISTCSAIVYALPAGTYYVQVAGASPSTAVPAYYLELKAQTDVGPEVEPNETIATATSISGTDIVMSGDHPVNAEADFYAITVPQGASIRAEIIEGPGSMETCEMPGMDPRLTLFDAATVQLVDDDDNGRGFCSMIDGTGTSPQNPGAHALEAGTYYLRVAASNFAQNGQNGQFAYRLQVTVR